MGKKVRNAEDKVFRKGCNAADLEVVKDELLGLRDVFLGIHLLDNFITSRQLGKHDHDNQVQREDNLCGRHAREVCGDSINCSGGVLIGRDVDMKSGQEVVNDSSEAFPAVGRLERAPSFASGGEGVDEFTDGISDAQADYAKRFLGVRIPVVDIVHGATRGGRHGSSTPSLTSSGVGRSAGALVPVAPAGAGVVVARFS